MKQNVKSMKNRLLLLLVLLSFVPIGVFAQNITVKGTVLDSQGETIIGATVTEKGKTSNGVITDLEGRFSLNVPKGKKIVVSYVGMETQEVDAVSGKDLKITMRDDAQSLDEVVVLGYGRGKKGFNGFCRLNIRC